MFKTIKRTEGISTTDLVGRMLLMNRAHHVRPPKDVDEHTAAAVGGQRLRERAMSVDVDDDMLAEVRWRGEVAAAVPFLVTVLSCVWCMGGG